jgi:hypothetical protein
MVELCSTAAMTCRDHAYLMLNRDDNTRIPEMNLVASETVKNAALKGLSFSSRRAVIRAWRPAPSHQANRGRFQDAALAHEYRTSRGLGQ